MFVGQELSDEQLDELKNRGGSSTVTLGENGFGKYYLNVYWTEYEKSLPF